MQHHHLAPCRAGARTVSRQAAGTAAADRVAPSTGVSAQGSVSVSGPKGTKRKQ